MKIAYLLTTFPKLSETFLQREIRVLLKLADSVQINSLWGGSNTWEGQTVHCFRLTKLIRLLPELVRWSIRKPSVVMQASHTLLQGSPANFKNFAETMLGLGFGIIEAQRFKSQQPDLMHAAWATMPATACWLIHQLTGIPYSMGAHAYDIYEDGGDWLLTAKLKQASLVHTSTQAAYQYLTSTKGARSQKPEARRKKLVIIYRGLNNLPDYLPKQLNQNEPLHLLSIGRLVAKKGWLEQLAILAALKQAGIRFQARIIGEGPMLNVMQRTRATLNLGSEVTFTGQIDYSAMDTHYRWADAFLFTGKIAPNGDRDGLPNVIPEAMAYGVPVLTTAVSGTTEAIRHAITGWVLSLDHPQTWVDTLSDLRDQHNTAHVRQSARQWVEQHFVAEQNTRTLFECMQHSLVM